MSNVIWVWMVTIAFGFLYQVSLSTLLVSGAIGTAAWVLAFMIGPGSVHTLIGDFVGAFFVGALAEFVARFRRQPISLFVVPAIIIFVPGYMAYQTILAFIQNQYVTGLQNGLHALLAASSLSIGLAAASAFVRPLARRLLR